MFKPLQSTNVTTHNVLLKITVPKRVRVRRRRGSQGPLHGGRDNGGTSDSGIKQTNQESAKRDTQSLIGNMDDNPTKYQVQIVGSVGRTHRFRGISI